LRVFKSKFFTHFADREGIMDSALWEAVAQAEKGLVDAYLGGGVIKMRIARPGHGKAGGYRSIVLFRSGQKAFFVYGFAKSERDNISRKELEAFKKLAAVMLKYGDDDLEKAIYCGVLTEVGKDVQSENV